MMDTEQLIKKLEDKFEYRNWRRWVHDYMNGIEIPISSKIAIEREMNMEPFKF